MKRWNQPGIARTMLFCLIACTASPVSFAQDVVELSKWMIEDKDVPDVIGQYLRRAKDYQERGAKTLENIIQLKLDSIQRRIKMSESTIDHLAGLQQKHRAEADKMRQIADQSLELARGQLATKPPSQDGPKEFAIPISRSVAEEMLRLAMLEDQKLRWDIAAEQALAEQIAKTASPSEAAKAELDVANRTFEESLVYLEGLEREHSLLRSSFEKGTSPKAELLKSESQIRVAHANVDKAKATLRMVEAHIGARESQSAANAQQEFIKLTARKKSVEATLQSLLKLMPALREHDDSIRKSEQHEASSEALSKRIEEERQRKMNLNELANLINEAK